MKRVLFPGSFDPIHFGHMQIIERACSLFDVVYIGILVNNEKAERGDYLLKIKDRYKLIKKLYEGNKQVKVVYSMNSNIIDLAKKCKCDTIIRGIRSESDFLSETRFNQSIRDMSKAGIEVVYLITYEDHEGMKKEMWAISSSIIRKRLLNREELTGLCPTIVKEYLEQKFRPRR